MKIQIFLLTLICLINVNAYAQNPEWITFTTLNSPLPENVHNSIAIDNNGNGWVAVGNPINGDGGLVIIPLATATDTDTWSVYDTLNSVLPDNEVISVAIDNNENKWIGTAEGLVKIGPDSTWTFLDTLNTLLLADIAFPLYTISSIGIDGSGNTWIGTICRLVKYDGLNWKIYGSSDGIDAGIKAIAIDSSDNVWVGTGGCGPDGGLLKLAGDTVQAVYNTGNSGIPSDEVRSLAVEGNGSVWVGTDENGLAKFDGNSTWTIYDTTNSDIPDNQIIAIAIDGNGDIWVGTEAGGLAKFDGVSTWTSYLPGDYIRSITVDAYNNKWIGTWYSDLAIYQKGGVISVIDKDLMEIPKDFTLYQNYPNPFNPTTIIKYNLPKKSKVILRIYNLLGQEVRTLVNKIQTPGLKSIVWDGKNNFRQRVSSGIYIYRLQAGNEIQNMKMLLLK